MDIIKRCLDFKREGLERHGEYVGEIVLSEVEYHELLCRGELLVCPRVPRPPISSVTTTTRAGGLFSATTVEVVETYDHNDSKYLKALERHETDCGLFMKQYPHGLIFGMKVLLA